MLTATSVQAYTGHELLSDLKSQQKARDGDLTAAMKAIRGKGYVDGAAHTLYMLSRICPTQSITGEQVLNVVSEYIENNPDKRGYEAAILISVALDTAFPPCAK